MDIKHVKIPIKDIILIEENPRTISAEDLQKLIQDIKNDPNFLYQRPSLINLVDGKYNCYAGTQRIKAQKEMGETEAICFVEENVPLELQRERMLKDNLHRGKWDSEKLFDLDIDIIELEDFGFEKIDLLHIEDGDFEKRNNEIDVNDFEDEMVIKLKYSEQDYHKVLGALQSLAETPEQAIKNILKIE